MSYIGYFSTMSAWYATRSAILVWFGAALADIVTVTVSDIVFAVLAALVVIGIVAFIGVVAVIAVVAVVDIIIIIICVAWSIGLGYPISSVGLSLGSILFLVCLLGLHLCVLYSYVFCNYVSRAASTLLCRIITHRQRTCVQRSTLLHGT